MPDGGWYIHPEFNTTWTNLSGCYDPTRTSGTSILVPAIIEVIYHVRKEEELEESNQCSGRVGSSCSSSDTRRVNLVE